MQIEGKIVVNVLRRLTGSAEVVRFISWKFPSFHLHLSNHVCYACNEMDFLKCREL